MKDDVVVVISNLLLRNFIASLLLKKNR